MVENVWVWFNNYYRAAIRTGDFDRQRLVELWREAQRFIETEPDESLALIERGILLAQRLEEPCFIMFYNYWRTELYLFYKFDYANALDHAARGVVEARKPDYARCPLLADTFRILADSYIYTDPVGYHDQAWEVIRYLEANYDLDSDTDRLLIDRRRTLYYAMGDLEKAYDISLKFLESCDDSDFQLTYAYVSLCGLTYRRGALDDALQYAETGHFYARISGRLRSQISLTAWSATIHLRMGDLETAQHFYDRTQTQVAAVHAAMPSAYYWALAEYYEHSGDAEAALRIRDEELNVVIAGKSIYGECEIRLERARLMGRLNSPRLAEEIAAAKQSATKLLKPDLYLGRLARVEQGIYTDMW